MPRTGQIIMAGRLDDLVERQNKAWSRMQEIQRAADDEKRDWTAEERANWDAANGELEQVSEDIERLNRAARLEAAEHGKPADTGDQPVDERSDEKRREDDYRDAFWAYARNGMPECSPEQRQMLRGALVSAKEMGVTRALGAGTGSAGGYTVPTGFRAIMTETMKAFGGMLTEANVITTSEGNPLPWPSNDDTSNVGAILGENTQIGEQDFTFGQQSLGAYTYTSKLVRVPWTLIQDSAFDLETWLPRKLGERIGRAQAPHLVAGTGSNQPTGLLASAVAGVTGAVSASAAITFDNLVDIEHSVDPAYRSSPRCKYLLGDGTLRLIRKLKDNDGRPLFQPIPAPGFPATINGYPYVIDNSMPAPAPGVRSLLFGDLYAGLIIRQVRDVQLVRLEERYADFLQTGFFAFSRMDAKPDDLSAVRAFQHGAAS